MAGISSQLQALLSIVTLNLVLISATVGAFWAGVFVARLLGRSVSFSLSPLGFSRPRRGILAGVGVGVSVGMAAVLLGGMVNALTTVVFERLGYSTESRVQQEFMRSLTGWIQDQPGIAIPAIVAVVVLFGPFAEEMIFRGAVFNGLYRLGRLTSKRVVGGKEVGRVADGASFALAALASSAVFATLHLEPVLLPSLLLLAVALCWLFRWSGSLLPSFVAHATFNSFATLLIILSGLGVFELPV
ncbi:MAG: CPBP family intramembrane metalloprotease [Actinomycetota bacterium]|nr:CPBP family intramembrane metalloprotease [Actinomycetota bacterium]